ncbi:IS3 family transposase [Paludibaculum fermentans]|uniref:IS3 family transposase n=1 Tax=Paludibaculum fermentans TaxID=1473598 RepID=UPI0022650B88|nr:IS3 family transposase [Paludibaculum fermentans]
MEWMCWLARVSRAGYYRAWQAAEPDSEEMELRDHIQRIALANRFYGYRRVARQLKDEGRLVNRKRVARLMRLDNLLAVRRKAFRPPTTDSKHGLHIHLNLAARMKVTGPNQLWIADITYIRLKGEFVFLAVVLDAWSRKVIGWNLSRSLQSEMALKALCQALEARKPAAGLVHHSDRGIQYATEDYYKALKKHGVVPSMSRARNPWDNATCESFMKTLKAEEVNGKAYRNMEELQAQIGPFLNEYYNKRRLHSSLGYSTPEKFEELNSSAAPLAAVLEFYKA